MTAKPDTAKQATTWAPKVGDLIDRPAVGRTYLTLDVSNGYVYWEALSGNVRGSSPIADFRPHEATSDTRPLPEPQPCVITDIAGDRLCVDSKPGDPYVVVWAFEGVLLEPDQAVQHAHAVLAHAAARRADAKESGR